MTTVRTVGGDLIAACGGTEPPLRTQSGRTLISMWNRVTGEHASYYVERDVFLTNEEATDAMGKQ